MQSKVLKKTLESINFDFRRNGLEEDMLSRSDYETIVIEKIDAVEGVKTD